VSAPLPLIVRELGGAGAPLVVLHGLLGSSRNWQSAGVALAERGHRVLAPDLRNHGSSPWGDDCSYAALSADVVAMLDRLALGPVHLVGHSMGGKAAMRLVMDRPDLVARLTVVDIAPRAYSDRVRVEFAAMSALDLSAVKSRKDAEEKLAAQVSEWGMRQFILTNLGQDAEGRWRWTVNREALTKFAARDPRQSARRRGMSGTDRRVSCAAESRITSATRILRPSARTSRGPMSSRSRKADTTRTSKRGPGSSKRR